VERVEGEKESAPWEKNQAHVLVGKSKEESTVSCPSASEGGWFQDPL
jgi:hypothetical protein